jgi:adenosine deaminase
VIPKAELHVHLEGTAPPALIRRLAERNGMTVPEGVFKTEDEFEWTDFLHFLRTYDLAASAIRTPQDYRDVTYEYLAACAAEGALYVELIASPDHAAAVGLSDADHYAGIAQGIDDARADHGIEARIVLAAIRNLGVESAEGIARRHADGRHPYVVGFNLVGDEAAWPAGLFARAYEIAAGSGLGCTVHAGEHAGPESVRAALELPITRISHGVRAIEDPALVAELAERGIVLEVCPSSNVSLGLFPSYEDHPLGALREAGVRVTLGSDDPPYFGCSIGSEYAVARERIGFDEEQLRDVTRIAVEASFAEDAVKEALSARLDFPEHRDSH